MFRGTMMSLAIGFALATGSSLVIAEPKVPATPEEHFALAKQYKDKAETYRKQAAEHRKMAAEHPPQAGERQPGGREDAEHPGVIVSGRWRWR